MLEITCPICLKGNVYSEELPATLNGEVVYHVIKCEFCETSFFNPLPTPRELEEHYSNDYGFYNPNPKAKGKGFAFGRRYLSRAKIGNFLDVGCASGDFLSGVHQGSGWNVFGTDIDPDTVQRARERFGLDIRLGEIMDVGFQDGFFDFIHVHDVLEHVTDPLGFMRNCRKILSDDGLLYLSVPNGLADVNKLKMYYERYNAPAASNAGHIFYFTTKSLDYIFKNSGFKVKKSFSYGFKNGLRAFGLYPNRKDWNIDMSPRPKKNVNHKPAGFSLNVNSPASHSQAYYSFHFYKNELLNIPGMYNFANDFIVTLEPI